MIVAFVRSGFATVPWTSPGAPPLRELGVASQTVGSEYNIDLRKGLSWPLRNQIATPACTAYAAMACVELSRYRAGDTPAIERLSAAAAYYYMKKHAEKDKAQPVRAQSPGYTRFRDAVSFLQQEGFVYEEKWKDHMTETKPPRLPRRVKIADVCYHSYPLPEKEKWYPPKGSKRPAGIAWAIYRELSRGYPVGAGFPAYARPEGQWVTNWSSAFENGIVPTPRTGDVLDMEAGHAVCIIGFVTQKRESITAENISEGHFIFRNSFGEAFACAPTTGYPQGYGLVKAEFVDKCCWEIMFMRKPSAGDPLAWISHSFRRSWLSAML